MDWDDLKIALAIARHGSLNAAARALGTTQPTVSRRLDGLERQIGEKLFERAVGGLSPTPLCAALLESLGRMEEAAQAVERRVAARDTGLQGSITVTTLAWFGDDVLAPMLTRFGSEHPLLTINLINDPRVFNLSRLEADIALRIPGVFDQEDLVVRKVADVAFGLYASPDYLSRHGQPDFASGCAGHSVMSLVASSVEVAHIDWLHDIAPKAHVALRSNGLQSHIEAVEAGAAMAVLPRIQGDRRPALKRLEPPLPAPVQPVKLAVHADMRDSPRVRTLIEFLVRELKPLAKELHPDIDR